MISPFSLFKRKPINIDLFTTRPSVLKYSPVEPASKFVPDWWKNLPRGKFDEQTMQYMKNMRHCVGVTELFHRGFVIPLWSDVAVQVGQKSSDYGRYEFADNESAIHFHAPAQRGSFASNNDHLHMKIVSPWIARCDEDVKWLFTGLQYNQSNLFDYVVVNGIADFKFQHSTNINIFLPRKENLSVVVFPFGAPLLQVIPLDDREIKLHLHLIDQKEADLIISGPVTFEANYHKVKKVLSTRVPRV